MKEISINDCQLIMGGMAFITRTMLSNPAVRTGAKGLVPILLNKHIQVKTLL